MDKDLMFSLMKSKGQNNIDNLSQGLVDVMGYSNPEFIYPSFDEVNLSDGIDYNLFLESFNGSQGSSELEAILQYTSQDNKFDDISETMLGVAMVEMRHYSLLGDLILKLGGSIDRKFDSSNVKTGSNSIEACEIAIKSEETAIKKYEAIGLVILDNIQTRTSEICLQFLSKLIADETKHLEIFNNLLKKLQK